MRIEVVHALADRQVVLLMQLPDGTTAGQAVAMSGLDTTGQAAGQRIGIGGKLVEAARVLREGDRVELLRPLAADPKEARRQRARRRRR